LPGTLSPPQGRSLGISHVSKVLLVNVVLSGRIAVGREHPILSAPGCGNLVNTHQVNV
jgi:hypothetical protein